VVLVKDSRKTNEVETYDLVFSLLEVYLLFSKSPRTRTVNKL